MPTKSGVSGAVDVLREAVDALSRPHDDESVDHVVEAARRLLAAIDEAAKPVRFPFPSDPEPEVIDPGERRRRFQPITADFMATVPLVGLADVSVRGNYEIPGDSFDEPSVGLRVLNPGQIGVQAYDSANQRHPQVQPTLAMTSVSGRALAALLVVMAEESENVHRRHHL